nr:MAG TPA: hypothetical protein [Caudoviricetes sp.]
MSKEFTIHSITLTNAFVKGLSELFIEKYLVFIIFQIFIL